VSIATPKAARGTECSDETGPLASVALADDKATPPVLQPPEGMMAVDLRDGRRVFAPVGSDPDVVRARVESGKIAPC
jgi:hypothetical protein